ncbi:hypothetical protein [Flavobacterium capsici]|uniref:Uncharacterized protein n=1 Tax=Flavobacterium capsici TaxID=3075618 RepID=A0AA96EVB8_9FLAO|nr:MULTISPECIES: hypothetical protein [unclassified Flavobacterium]WNM19248.1 hypothetical protein RN608_00865 [Flavobacterium sp. PMR2A8]WNM20637.1 hypothetical protein RN605_08035 [Flavobacterium sp. PMTSA4]
MTNIRNYMLSTQTNIALQLVHTLSADELAAFEKEFSKLTSQKAQTVPKVTKKNNPNDVNVLANKLILRHRAKNIRSKSNLV